VKNENIGEYSIIISYLISQPIFFEGREIDQGGDEILPKFRVNFGSSKISQKSKH